MNSVMKSFMIVVVTLLAMVHAHAADAQMTREQAVAILIQQVITPMAYADYNMAAGPQTMLNSGDIVQPAYFSPPKVPGTVRNIQGPTWFFWVDTNKWAKFGHLVYFVYIDATNPNPTTGDGIIVDKADIYPQINGVDYRDASGRNWVAADIVYGTIPTAPPTVFPWPNQ